MPSARASTYRLERSTLRVSGWLRAFNTLCVLEALVAVVWQRGFALASGVALDWHHSVLLFAALWLVYVADRWLDAARTPLHRLTTERHRVFARHRTATVALWLLVSIGSVTLAWLRLTAKEWAIAALVLASTAAYFLLVHASRGPRWFLKELWVSAIFAVGTGMFTLARALSWQNALMLVTFALMVLLNVVGIANREQRTDTKHGTASIATEPPVGLDARKLERWVHSGSVGLAVAAVGLALFSAPLPARFYAGIAVAATALRSSWITHRNLGEEDAHALSDAVLLLPLPLWL